MAPERGRAGREPSGAGFEPGPSDAKRFGRNFASAAFAQFVSQVLTLGASIVLARKLDVGAYGMFVFGFAFPSWFLLLVSLGLDEVMATEVAAVRARAREYLTIVAIVRVLLAGIALAALWIGVHLLLVDPVAQTITMVLGAASVITAYANTFMSLFRAFERLEYAALVTIAERALTVSAVVVLLVAGFGLAEVSVAFLGGGVVLLALAAILARRRFAWFTRDIRAATLSHMLRATVPFALVNAVGVFSYTAGVVLLTVFQGPVAAGLFNASFTLLLALFSFLSIFSLAALPMMSRVNHESKERLAAMLHRIQKLSIIVGVPLALGGWFYADAILTTFYGPSFHASGESFRILVLAFSIETAVLGNGPVLAATGHAKQKLYAGFAGAATNVVLCGVLIGPLGPVGAALAFLAGNAVSSVLGLAMVRRYVAPIGEPYTLAKALVAGISMLVTFLALPGLSLWLGLVIGPLAYFGVLWLIRGASKSDARVVWEGIRGALFQ